MVDEENNFCIARRPAGADIFSCFYLVVASAMLVTYKRGSPHPSAKSLRFRSVEESNADSLVHRIQNICLYLLFLIFYSEFIIFRAAYGEFLF